MQTYRTDTALKTGFVLICLVVAAGIITGTLLPVAGGVAFLLLAVMVMGYPPRMTALLFLVQVIFTTLFLEKFSIYAGPFRIRPDDLLQLWVFLLWLGALVDGDGKVGRSSSGRLIGLLVLLSVLAFFHGLFRGYEAQTAAPFIKSILGYLFFFPCMWMLKEVGNRKLLTTVLLVGSIAAALWVLAKGFIGGEGVYVRATSGLRVSSRELNVVMVGLFIASFALWKRRMRMPVIAGIIAVVAMGAALLLGQSRALWIAVAAGLLAAFIAEMGRTGREGVKLGPLLARILLLAVFVAGSIAFVHTAGLLSPEDVAARTGGADGGFSGDASLWARFLSWWEITRTVTASPLNLLFGAGFGHKITYFRPDLMGVVSIPYVDGSFFQLLLNTGLLGSALLCLLYAGGIAGSFRLVLNSEDRDGILAGLWLTASFIALTIAALSSSLITNYRFTCIWAFLFALLETWRTGSGDSTR